MSTDINNDCVVTLRTPWHLRHTATVSDAGSRAYPGGDRVELLSEAPQMIRGAGEKGYNVRVISDGQVGFAFVPVSDVPASCQHGSSALSRANNSLIEKIFPASNSVVKAVGGPTNAAIATAVVTAGVVYYFYKKPSQPYITQVPRTSLASNPHKQKKRRK